jgi:hypothetical protein
MTTTTLPAPAPPSHDEDGDDFQHYFCCDASRSLCGLVRTEIIPELAGGPVNLCPPCEALDATGLPCGREGCPHG